MFSPTTPTMRRALAEIEREPGQPANVLPGGAATVRALMRRELCEVETEDWRVYPLSHDHRWQTTMHLDGCHFYESHLACECGARARTYSERSLRSDPYSVIWMDSEQPGRKCPRCEALIAGARPRHEVVIGRAPQTVAA